MNEVGDASQSLQTMANGSSPATVAPDSSSSILLTLPPSQSPPQSVVDCASLTNCMVKNKESLKVKLMQRRPIDVLVDQGILPRKFCWSFLLGFFSNMYFSPLFSAQILARLLRAEAEAGAGEDRRLPEAQDSAEAAAG